MIGNLSGIYAMAVPPQRPSARPGEEQPRTSAGGSGRILVVEDDYLVGLAIEQALLDAGYEVLAVVATGEEAVSRGRHLRPDLVLMDIRLAGQMTGIEAAVALRAEGVTSLFASAHSDVATRAAGEQAMPAGWLTKPFSASEIAGAVAAALAKSRSH